MKTHCLFLIFVIIGVQKLNAQSIAGGSNHTVVVCESGYLNTFGWNIYGQCGDSTVVDKWSPIRVHGLTGVKQVSSLLQHSLALLNDKTVWAWGYNASGQLGDSTTKQKTVPVQVHQLSDVKTISAGGNHSLALKHDGTVWAWGSNTMGQLGDSSKIDKNIPVQVKHLNNIIAIAAGRDYSLALKSDSTVWAWGENKNNGTVWVFGSGGSGQLGNDKGKDSHIPLQVANLCLPDITNVNELNNQLNGTDPNLLIYPNPTNTGQFTVSSSEIPDKLKIIDMFGKIIFQSKPSDKSTSLYLSKPGVYLIEIYSGNKLDAQKIVVKN